MVFSTMTLDTLGQIVLFFVGAVLCIVGFLTASLVSTHQMSVTPFPPSPSHENQIVFRHC